ncbi:pyridoxamine 5'-phosphate oxidase family protein [Specibacter sp. NPDC078692]|uniref:pyridoxamine 5'-phosphate oxidase family protein n=1 Tax=Specibacter sp. NPDC078692 TaxID=3155818 RepID=UPI003427771F
MGRSVGVAAGQPIWQVGRECRQSAGHFPLNFVATTEKIWIRTNPGTKLAEMTINALVALESDEVGDGEAWSVVVKGTARVVESQTEIGTADLLHLDSWTKARKWTYVEITPVSVNGRRLVLGGEPERY